MSYNREMDLITKLDHNLLYGVASLRSPTLNKILLVFTYLGKWYVVLAITVAVCLFLIIKKRWLYVKTLLASVLIAELFVEIFKNIIQRPRPDIVEILTHENGYSLPSGHSVASLSFYGLLAYILYKKTGSKRLKFLTVFLGTAIISIIGFSRVYLGAHWPSDVFLSMAAGLVWILFIIKIFKPA